jgi:Protein of unknown function (DUF2889)
MTAASVLRTMWMDVLPDTPRARYTSIHAQTRDVLRTPTGERTLHAIRLDVELDEGNVIRRLRSAPKPGIAALLVGQSCTRGFRALLDSLSWSTAGERATRRMLWELPIVSGLQHQTAMLEHPGANRRVPLQLAGANQCSGWRADGEMFAKAAADQGVLSMALTPLVGPPSAHGSVPDFVAALPAMGTRRTRTTTVTDDADRYAITVAHRDSYADPDGIQRRLHEWTTTATLDETGRLREVTTAPGQLPWLECPLAGLSTGALNGLSPGEVERMVTGWRGIGTCTHLNDSSRLFADVEDLVAAINDPRDRAVHESVQ